MPIVYGWAPSVVAVSVGEGVQPLIQCSEPEFFEVFSTHDVRERKDGPCFFRPLGGDGHRSDANVQPCSWYVMDIDELGQGEDKRLVEWLKQAPFRALVYTTFSHSPERPKLRVVVPCDREISVDEYRLVYEAIRALVPFVLDPCMLKPSQPIFLPSCPAASKEHAFIYRKAEGDLFEVDRLIASMRSQIDAQAAERKNSKLLAGTGVRVPGGALDYFNRHRDPDELLQKHGYKQRSSSRYVAPGSKSRRAAVYLYRDGEYPRVISFHDPAHDPVAQRTKDGRERVMDPFAVLCALEHNNDYKAALNAAVIWNRTQGWTDTSEPTVREPVKRTRLTIETATESYNAIVPDNYVVDSIVGEKHFIIASGESNAGKTTVLQHMAVCVAAGIPFGNYTTEQSKVLWIAGEDVANARKRLGALCNKLKIDLSALDDKHFIMPHAVAILDDDSLLDIHEVIKEKIGDSLGLIVMDSKAMTWGGEDENSNSENNKYVMVILDQFVARYGCAVIVTHHLTKQKEKEERTSRGASSLINGAHGEIRFEKTGTDRECRMSHGKIRSDTWEDMRWRIETVELRDDRFKNRFGAYPKVSIPAVASPGMGKRAQSEDDDSRLVLRALVKMRDDKVESKLRTPATIATLSGMAKERGPSAARQRVTRILEKLTEQKLYDDKERMLTEAGEDWLSTNFAAFDDKLPSASELSSDADGETT